MIRLLNLVLGGLAALAILAFLFNLSPPETCEAAGDCPQATTTGRQKMPTELAPYFDQAGKNLLGSEGPALPKLITGYPNTTLSNPYVPCTLLKAVGIVESSWKQYRANYGEVGTTLVSFDFGYGIMQITSGMSDCPPNVPTTFDRKRVAENSRYNIGTGALFMVSKWNNSPNIGTNNPIFVESWYYATWAYNGFAYVNNPNNPKFPTGRAPYNGTQPRGNYPYQELVWGYAANPPKINNGQPAWQAVTWTLPSRAAIGQTPPSHIELPQPAHLDCGALNTFIPMVIN